MKKRENLTNDPEVLALAARAAVKPSSMANLVMRYCSVCHWIKPKEGPHASDARFICEECSQ